MTAIFPGTVPDTTSRTRRPATSGSVAAEVLADHLRRSDVLAGVDLAVTERTWVRLAAGADAELWLITWPAGTSTGWHDHGSASGAFTVLRGSLTEHTWTGVATARTLEPGSLRTFDASHVHDVVNRGGETAVSLHAYAPSLAAMTRYELRRGRLSPVGVEQRGELW